MPDPSSIVLAFIADFLRWNNAALARYNAAPEPEDDDSNPKLDAVATARQEYAELLAKYCRPGFQGKPISFGTPSMHDPATEQILSIAPRGNRCLVKTGTPPKTPDTTPEIDWEYRLTQDADRWYLESIKSVVDGKRAESL